jgi:ATP-dependent Clp protease protease subunit
MKFYQITNLAPATAEIRIDGVIGESWNEDSVTSKQFIAELDALTAENITLYVNSPGGAVIDAYAIAEALNRKEAKIHAIVDGWALSSASMIVATADTVAIGKRSLMMIHNPQSYAYGDSSQLRKSAEVLDKIKAGLISAYDARIKQGSEAVSKLMDDETWFTAEEAVAIGLADSIVPDKNVPSPIPDNRFTKTPHNVLDMERKRIAAIRAAFAPWIKKGYQSLSSIKDQCEEDGSDLNTVNARILAELGRDVEPLGVGVPTISDSLSAAVAAYQAKNPTASHAQAETAVLRENPKLYDLYLTQRG